MKCPNCGENLEDGKLLCEKCGEEVNVVPVYESEIEDEIKEALSKMALEFSEEDDSSDDFDDDSDGISFAVQGFINRLFEKKNRVILIFLILIICILTGLLIFNGVRSSYKKSFSYQYSKAIECASTDHYEEASVFLEKALAIEPENIEARLLLAKYYDKCDRTQSSIKVLSELLNTDKEIDDDLMDEIYDYLLSLYVKMEEYEKMGNLLKKCNISRIVSKYNKYAALNPEFSKNEGVYNEIISIYLEGNTDGIIYYTLDGSTPNTNSSVFDTPILLESGDYVIKALFVNMYGVKSDIVTKTYYINLLTPPEPTINLESGSYVGPQFIEVYHNEQTKIYYTLDGTEPTAESIRYTEPIEMPYGMSNFAIVAINEEGLSSPVVKRTFTLKANGNIPEDLAIKVLMNNLIVNGDISDSEGHIKSKLGFNRYAVCSLVKINENVYYIINESYVDTIGKEHDTKNLYAIDSNSGDAFIARKLLEGKYILSKFD